MTDLNSESVPNDDLLNKKSYHDMTTEYETDFHWNTYEHTDRPIDVFPIGF